MKLLRTAAMVFSIVLLPSSSVAQSIFNCYSVYAEASITVNSSQSTYSSVHAARCRDYFGNPYAAYMRNDAWVDNTTTGSKENWGWYGFGCCIADWHYTTFDVAQPNHCYRAQTDALSGDHHHGAGSALQCAPPLPPADPPPPDEQPGDPPPCESCTPILIDLHRDGYDLTDSASGVLFDIDADGYLEAISWTSPGSDEAFLWLDRNGSGLVENGSELFGSAEYSNGFEKLAALDAPENGGNGDGSVDSSDARWNALMLWVDANHDGTCQTDEVFHLSETDIVRIDLRYQIIGKKDKYGNLFRYKSRIYYLEESGKIKLHHVFDVIFVPVH